MNGSWFRHLCGGFCAIIWGTTFLVSKALLETYSPMQIMLMRFIVGYICLWLICPKWHIEWKDEPAFLAMGLLANTLYYLAENSALLYTYSANVSIMVSAAPVITILLMKLLGRSGTLDRNKVTGILIAFGGMVLVVMNGAFVLHLSPVGDLLSLGAACCWSCYGIVLAAFTDRYSGAMISRKLMLYGILSTIPLMLVRGELQTFPLKEILQMQNMAGILFLGVVGSGLCYTAWNHACAGLGVVVTNMYIYVIPFVTLVAGAIFRKEPITIMAVAGALLIVIGMAVSAKKEN